jgi:hypothetical protein
MCKNRIVVKSESQSYSLNWNFRIPGPALRFILLSLLPLCAWCGSDGEKRAEEEVDAKGSLTLKAVRHSSLPVPIDRLEPGTIIGINTNRNHYVKLRVDRFETVGDLENLLLLCTVFFYGR